MVEYIVAIDVTRVRFPADAFQLCGQQFGIPSDLLHVLHTKTHRMAVFEDHCAKAMLTEVVLRHLASDMRSPDLSEHKDSVVDVGGRPEDHPDVLEPGQAFISPSREGRGWCGTGRERALRAPLNTCGCLFCCLGQLAFAFLAKLIPPSVAIPLKVSSKSAPPPTSANRFYEQGDDCTVAAQRSHSP